MRSVVFAAAVSAVALMSSGPAGALPLAPVESSAVESNLLLVRDGCGPGMRYSHRMQACVRDFGPPPPYGYRPPPPPPPRPICPPGMRFSYRAQACVWF